MISITGCRSEDGDGQMVPIPIERITNIDINGKSIRIHTFDGTFYLPTNMEMLQKMFAHSAPSFQKVDRWTIIDTDKIQAFDQTWSKVYFDDEKKTGCDVSRKSYEMLKRKILRKP